MDRRAYLAGVAALSALGSSLSTPQEGAETLGARTPLAYGEGCYGEGAYGCPTCPRQERG